MFGFVKKIFPKKPFKNKNIPNAPDAKRFRSSTIEDYHKKFEKPKFETVKEMGARLSRMSDKELMKVAGMTHKGFLEDRKVGEIESIKCFGNQNEINCGIKTKDSSEFIVPLKGRVFTFDSSKGAFNLEIEPDLVAVYKER